MHEEVDLREVMRRWVSGVAILTTGSREIRHGMTVNSFTSISIEPPLVTVTMNNETRTKRLVDETGYFAINLLSEEQHELADFFAGRLSEMEDRFYGLEVRYGVHNLPVLVVVAAYVECKVVHRYEMLNSTLYVGEVLSAKKAENRPPLVYFNREFHRIIQ